MVDAVFVLLLFVVVSKESLSCRVNAVTYFLGAPQFWLIDESNCSTIEERTEWILPIIPLSPSLYFQLSFQNNYVFVFFELWTRSPGRAQSSIIKHQTMMLERFKENLSELSIGKPTGGNRLNGCGQSNPCSTEHVFVKNVLQYVVELQDQNDQDDADDDDDEDWMNKWRRAESMSTVWGLGAWV